jgi:hypothetical protein
LGSDLILKLIILKIVIKLHRELSIRGIEQRWINGFAGNALEERFRQLVIWILRTMMGSLLSWFLGMVIYLIPGSIFSTLLRS